MPPLTTGVGSKSATTSFVDVRGKTTTVNADNLPGTASEALVTAYQLAIGNLSNAAIFKKTYTGETEKAIPDVTAFDEAESSVTTAAHMTFQNTATLATRQFTVPAPDMDAISDDGNFLEGRDVNNQVDAAVVAILAMLGAGWVYVNSPISTRKKGTVQGSKKPIAGEPGVGDLPPPGPGE